MLSSSTGQHRDEFLAQTKAAREERQLAVVRAAAATRIQALVRGWLARLEAVNVCGECAAGGRNFNIQFKSGHVNDKCYTSLTLSRPLPGLGSCFISI